IPGLCDVVVDCRLPPGESPRTIEPTIRAILGAVDYELEWLEAMGGTRSPLETPLWHALERFVAEEEPGARLAPIICPGFTDSHWLRDAFGTAAYGFFPSRAMEQELAARLIHSADERVPVDDLELGVRFLRSVALQVTG
ncbi:MAG TPA: M20/M25/M40 family metallo-hydrolase, partial [Gaiellaceae bacterium]